MYIHMYIENYFNHKIRIQKRNRISCQESRCNIHSSLKRQWQHHKSPFYKVKQHEIRLKM